MNCLILPRLHDITKVKLAALENWIVRALTSPTHRAALMNRWVLKARQINTREGVKHGQADMFGKPQKTNTEQSHAIRRQPWPIGGIMERKRANVPDRTPLSTAFG